MGKVKQWKNGGEEDKFIEKQIRKGKINRNSKAKNLKSNWPGLFSEFSDNVIRNHLTALQRSSGVFLNGSDSDISDVSSGDEYNLKESSVTQTKKAETSNDSSRSSDNVTGFSNYSNHNFPVICEKFTDPVTEYEKVLLVVLIHSGVEVVKAILDDDGIKVTIKYEWPKTTVDVLDLFKNNYCKKISIRTYHPMVLCYKAGLEKVRKNIDMSPESCMRVNLPMRVQTAVDSWKKWGVLRDDGTQVLLMEFTGYVKEYIKKKADESCTFEK